MSNCQEAEGEAPNDLVVILLSVFNGARFLREQLTSLSAQTHRNWVLFWRDDGSNDESRRILLEFTEEVGADRVIMLAHPVCRVGIALSYRSLLHAAPEEAAFFAFCDQDDVWMPDKLARAVAHLRAFPSQQAGLYCSRQVIVNKMLRPLRLSPIMRHLPGLRNALVQNIATGCTVVINQNARRHVLSVPVPKGSLHDQWAYLVVSAVGGKVFFDPIPSIFYRQHNANEVGNQGSIPRRFWRAVKRGPAPFLRGLAENLYALSEFGALSPEAKKLLLESSPLQSRNAFVRFSALRKLGFYRQTLLEDLLMRLWISMRPLPPPEKPLRLPKA